jgi:hypothetical protein
MAMRRPVWYAASAWLLLLPALGRSQTPPVALAGVVPVASLPADSTTPVAPTDPVAPISPVAPTTPANPTDPAATTKPTPPAMKGPALRDTTRDPLNRLLEPRSPAPADSQSNNDSATPVRSAYAPTLGFAGPSGVMPRSGFNNEFETVEDRWRIGFPEWDRYGLDHPTVFDYPYRLGRWFDPYNQNVLKGDYPIIGQNIFLELTGTAVELFDGRNIPTATTPFESTARPGERDFFGRSGQFLHNELYTFSIDLFEGDAAFKPVDWRVKLTPATNLNILSVQEVGVVSPNVTKGEIRERTWTTLQEWFVEYKLADLSPEYDFVSVRAGSQPFVSDFRGFIFSDTNRGLRLFGNLDGNQIQWNLAYFRQQEKDTNSQLNEFNDRRQNIVVANIYRQDFLFPGYTAEASFHYNNDSPSTLYDKNGFLVRPDPAGVFQPHRVEAYYLGLTGDGHIDRFNISNAFYWVLGRDSMNPIAGIPQAISAQMAALELSYDRDWVRFRMSGFYSSGDGNPNNGHATGFDGILDQTEFGGDDSYFRRNRIPLFGVGLVNGQSLYDDLRSSRIQGQSNFVNPGLWLANAGVDFDITPRFRIVNNANYIWFDKTAVLSTFLFQGKIDRTVGLDLSTGFEWRPRLNNNLILMSGLGMLLPGSGFRELYNEKDGKVPPLLDGFLQMILQF